MIAHHMLMLSRKASSFVPCSYFTTNKSWRHPPDPSSHHHLKFGSISIYCHLKKIL